MADIGVKVLESTSPDSKCVDQYALLPPYVGAFLAEQITELKPDEKVFLYGYLDPTKVTLEKVLRVDLLSIEPKPKLKPRSKPHDVNCGCFTCLRIDFEDLRDAWRASWTDEKKIDAHLDFYKRKPGWHTTKPLYEVLPFFFKLSRYCSVRPQEEPPILEEDGYEAVFSHCLTEKYGHVIGIVADRLHDRLTIPITIAVEWTNQEMPGSQLISPDIQPGILDLETLALNLKPGFLLRTRKDRPLPKSK